MKCEGCNAILTLAWFSLEFFGGNIVIECPICRYINLLWIKGNKIELLYEHKKKLQSWETKQIKNSHNNIERNKSCELCLQIASYSRRYDAMFCKKCNIWLEPECDDPKCFYCKERPAKPYFS